MKPASFHDPVRIHRRKTRFIVELRYEAVPQFFDMRGRIIGELHLLLKKQFPHWRVSDEQILFAGDVAVPRDQFIISTKRTMFVLEDPPSLEDFVTRAEPLLRASHNYLGKWWPAVARLGVRFLEVVRTPHATHQATRVALLDAFHKNPLALPLTFTDSQAVLVHDRGRLGIGPTKLGDEWIAQVFQDSKANVPDIGIAVDVDSFEKSFEVATPEVLCQVFRSVLDLTMTVEAAALRALKVM
jgi:hypothetical protein